MENIYLDNFTKDNVDLRKQSDSIWRRNYRNSEFDRQMVEKEVPSPYKEVIFLMWGDESTVFED